MDSLRNFLDIYLIIIFITFNLYLLDAVAVTGDGTWYDVQLTRVGSDGATELSFLTSYKQTVIYVAISSSVAKNCNSPMPSQVSSDNSIEVRSSIHIDKLVDSVADCIAQQTDAYTMLVRAVWRNMKDM